MDHSLPGSLSRQILQPRILEWRCPPPGDLPNPGTERASCISPALAGGFFTINATWETHYSATASPINKDSNFPPLDCHTIPELYSSTYPLWFRTWGHMLTIWRTGHRTQKTWSFFTKAVPTCSSFFPPFSFLSMPCFKVCLGFFLINFLFQKKFLITRDYKIVQSSHISTPHPVSPEVNILHNLDTFVKTSKLTLIRCC